MTMQRYPAHIRSLRASLNGTRKAMRQHRKMCSQCRNAYLVDKPSLSCDTGWQWAKDEHRFMTALERAGHPELLMAGDQLALW